MRRIAADVGAGGSLPTGFMWGWLFPPARRLKSPESGRTQCIHSVSCIQFHPHRLSVDFRPDICPCGGVVPLGPHLDLRCTAPSIHSSLLWDSLCHLSPRHPRPALGDSRGVTGVVTRYCAALADAAILCVYCKVCCCLYQHVCLCTAFPPDRCALPRLSYLICVR